MRLTETQKYDAAVLSVIGFYLVALFFSYGYLQADEHFQVIEFGYYFVGENQASELAWEFKEQIRPALQPIIAAGAIQLNSLFDEGDIYSVALILRLLTMILSLIVLLKFANSQRKRFEFIDTYWYYFISLGLWFIVFFSFRFSSEAWSGLLALLAMTFYYEKRSFWLIGIFFGLAFLFRFQIGFLVLGFVLNLVVFKRINIKQLIELVVFMLLIICLGVFVDSLFYGELTCTAWNYLKFNIIDSGASGFGELPWYYYLLFLLKKPFVVLGVLILLSTLLNFYSDYKNPIVWGVVFFLFFHSIVPHKESRFLIPIAFLAPWFLFNSLKLVKSRKINLSILVVLGIINLVPLTVVSLKSAGPGYVYMGKLINEKYEDKEVVMFSFSYSNPYYHWDKKLKNHYNLHDSKVYFVQDANHLDQTVKMVDTGKDSVMDMSKSVRLITIRDRELIEFKNSEFFIQNQPKYISASHPDWILKVLRWYNGFHYFEVVHLFELEEE